MDKTIKTRDVVKDIRVLDKKTAMSSGIKEAYAKTKEVAGRSSFREDANRNGSDYANNKVDQSLRSAAAMGSRGIKKSAGNAANSAKDAYSKAKEAKRGTQKATQATKQIAHNASTSNSKGALSRAANNRAKSATKTSSTVAKRSVKQGAKGTIKTAGKSIKTTKATAGKAIKTSRQAARGAKVAARGAQHAARNAALAARTASRAAAVAAKVAAKAIAAFVKMAIAATKSLVAAIAAGGWVAVVVVLVILLVGAIAASAFGIFFAGDDMGDGNPSLRSVIAETNEEHQAKIEEIKNSNSYDELALTGSKTAWKETLAVFSVKTTTNTDDPLDVLTMDTHRQELLKQVFWDMNQIDSTIQEREVTEIVLETDEEGNSVESTETYTVRTLKITLSHKTADEIASTYGFSQKQQDLLHELLDPKNDSMWQSVLYGIHSGSGDIVEVAATQLGNVGGAPYWSWYGFSGRVEWCACFVSWCANECGYIETGVIPKFAACPNGVSWFSSAGLWQDRGYAPKPGDIIFFDWEGDAVSDHVGIVESCDGSTVFTIEGNSGDACTKNSYSVNNSSILGYGTPLY